MITTNAVAQPSSKTQVLDWLARGKRDDGSAYSAAEAGADLVRFEPARGVSNFTMKVSEKGCVQMRGLPGVNVRFGLTLYAKTVQALFEHKDELEKFIAAHQAELSWSKATS